MASFTIRNALRCSGCGVKRQVALLLEHGFQFTKYQICAPCSIEVLTALLRDRKRSTSERQTRQASQKPPKA